MEAEFWDWLMGWLPQTMAAALFTGLGWLAGRKLTRQNQRDATQDLATRVQLLESLKRQGMSHDDAIDIVDGLKESGSSISSDTMRFLAKFADDDHLIEDAPNTTSSLMINEGLSLRLKRVEAELEERIFDYIARTKLGDIEAFNQAQEKWLEWRDAQQAFAGSRYIGGSIMIAAELSEAIAITEQRIAQVEEMIEYEKGL